MLNSHSKPQGFQDAILLVVEEHGSFYLREQIQNSLGRRPGKPIAEAKTIEALHSRIPAGFKKIAPRLDDVSNVIEVWI